MRLRYRRRRAWLRPFERSRIPRGASWLALAFARFRRRRVRNIAPRPVKRLRSPRRVKPDALRLALMRARNVAQGLPPECPF